MGAGKHNFTIEQGATFERVLTITDDGVARDLTGHVFAMQARRHVADAEAAFEVTCAVTSAAGGQVTLSMTAAETADLAAGNYVYDLDETTPDDFVIRLLQGNIMVSPEITR